MVSGGTADRQQQREHIMPKYVFAYHGGGMAETEAEQQAEMAAWGAWMGSHESAWVDMGAPTGASMTVSANGSTEGGGANPISGYGLIEAPDLQAACAIAAGCPIIGNGGTVEVAETFEIPEM
jgi:hypothetical protein